MSVWHTFVDRLVLSHVAATTSAQVYSSLNTLVRVTIMMMSFVVSSVRLLLWLFVAGLAVRLERVSSPQYTSNPALSLAKY